MFYKVSETQRVLRIRVRLLNTLNPLLMMVFCELEWRKGAKRPWNVGASIFCVELQRGSEIERDLTHELDKWTKTFYRLPSLAPLLLLSELTCEKDFTILFFSYARDTIFHFIEAWNKHFLCSKTCITSSRMHPPSAVRMQLWRTYASMNLS